VYIFPDGSRFAGTYDHCRPIYTDIYRYEHIYIYIGVYIFPDGSRFAGTFDHGRPLDGEYTQGNGVTHTVSYKGDKCLWEGVEPVSMTGVYPPPHMTHDMHVSSSSYDTFL
jgi:hypothetical protein